MTIARTFAALILALFAFAAVAQPRDHNPLAAYGLYDDESQEYRLKRVAYDIQTAQEKILRAGLPPSLARRLAYGQ